MTVTAPPVFSLASGVYHTVETVTITDATPGAKIYYTTDGSSPTSSSIPYTGPIQVSASTGFHAMAIHGNSTSASILGWYTINLPTPTPVPSVAAGTYNKIQSVALTDSAPNATIYYTLDGTYPSTSSRTYTGPIQATLDTTIVAIATAPNYEPGPALKASYTIVAPAPVITPGGGTFQSSVAVTMTDAVAGAQIHWTKDGSSPTASSPLYTGAMAAGEAESVTDVYQAIATAPGYHPSATTIATFMVDQTAGNLAQVTVGTTSVRTIPGTFIGFSLSAKYARGLMGLTTTGANTPLQTMMKNLRVNSGAPVPFRILGDDTDLADVQSAVLPLSQFAAAVKATYTLGVDMFHNSTGLAGLEAIAWQAGIPSKYIQGFELGNEPDVYPYNGARTRAYTFAEYLLQYQQWATVVGTSTGGSIGMVGPSMGQETNWVPNTEMELASGVLKPVQVAQHAYVGGATQNGSPTGIPWPLDELLTPAAATAMPAKFAAFATSAHRSGHTFRMNEVNSFWGGIPGISNTFQSALWSVDLMFNYLKAGVDGVNWNDDDTSYRFANFQAPVDNSGIAQYSITQVNPLYYGLLTFSQMANNGGRLLPVTTTTTANVSVWGTIDNSSTVHVVVINKDEKAAGKVSISLPGYSTGTVRYLTAAGYAATNGVTLGGQTFDGSTDGKIRGTLVTSTITGGAGGNFAIANVPIECAAVIDFTK